MPDSTPRWQPLSKLPTLTYHIDAMLEATQEQYRRLLPAKAKSHFLDDYTVNDVRDVFLTQLNDLWIFDEQLKRWKSERLTQAQQIEIERLQRQMTKLRSDLAAILDLADALDQGTIEKVMAKRDVELGLEFPFKVEEV